MTISIMVMPPQQQCLHSVRKMYIWRAKNIQKLVWFLTKEVFPIFDQVSAYDTHMPLGRFESVSYKTQMTDATKQLKSQLENDVTLKNKLVQEFGFDETQFSAIQSGKSKIPGFTWHHHQDKGRMQLVREQIHRETGHVGGEAMSGGQ